MNNLNKIKNKRADFSIVIFVLLVALLTGYALYGMASNRQQVRGIVTGFDQIEGWLVEKKDLEYRLYKLGEECLVKTYITQKNYENLTIWSEKNSNSELNQRLESCLKENSDKKRNSIQDNTDYRGIQSLFGSISTFYKTSIFFDGKKLTINLDDFSIKPQDQDTNLRTKLISSIYYDRIGLISHEKIIKIIKCEFDEECKENINKDRFHITKKNEEIDDINYILYKFNSSRKFLIENEFKEISFSILVLNIQDIEESESTAEIDEENQEESAENNETEEDENDSEE